MKAVFLIAVAVVVVLLLEKTFAHRHQNVIIIGAKGSGQPTIIKTTGKKGHKNIIIIGGDSGGSDDEKHHHHHRFQQYPVYSNVERYSRDYGYNAYNQGYYGYPTSYSSYG